MISERPVFSRIAVMIRWIGVAPVALAALVSTWASAQSSDPVLPARPAGTAALPRYAAGPRLHRIGQHRPRRPRHHCRAYRRPPSRAWRRGGVRRAAGEHGPLREHAAENGQVRGGALQGHRHEADSPARAHGHRLPARHARETAVPDRRRSRLRPRHRTTTSMAWRWSCTPSAC